MAVTQRENARALIERYEAYYAEASTFRNMWQLIGHYVAPNHANIIGNYSPGMPQTEFLMDSTAPHAVKLLSSSMQGSLTSQAVKWYSYRVRGLQQGQLEDVDDWLEKVGTQTDDDIRQSNFNAEVSQFYTNLVAFGIGALFIGEKPPTQGGAFTGLNFKCLPTGSFVVDEGEDGNVDTVAYKHCYTARQAAAKFGIANLPKVIAEKAAKSDSTADEKFEFIHFIKPRTKAMDLADTTVLPAHKRPWASFWIASVGDDSAIVEEKGYYEFPVACARWDKQAGEKYGRSQSWIAMPDIRTLNRAVELTLRAMAVMVLPPVLVRDDGVLSAVRLMPGGQTKVRDMEAVQALQLNLAQALQVGNVNVKELQAAIRRMFFADQLQLQEGPQMTAYEVQVRYELMQRILGPTLGRVENEFLSPVVRRVYSIMSHAKRIEPMPATLSDWLKNNNVRFDIEYEGPLARAQRLANSVSLQRFLGLTIPLVEVDPGVLDIIDMDAAIRDAARSTAVSESIIRGVRATKEKRDARVAEQRAMQQQAQQAETLKAAGAGAPALKALMEAQQQGILPQGGLPGSAGLG